MTECDCGAPTDGKWAGKHTSGCAFLTGETPANILRELLHEIGWRGLRPSHLDLFKCEFCGQEHLDCFEIPHTDGCYVTRARRSLDD